jgi:hypothetical protein
VLRAVLVGSSARSRAWLEGSNEHVWVLISEQLLSKGTWGLEPIPIGRRSM